MLTIFHQRTPAQIDAMELDATVSEQHAGEVDVTEDQVEVGANIVDHARPKPEQLTIEGVVTNTPLAPRVRALDPEIAYAKLREIKDKTKLVSIITPLRTYDNMLMTSLSVPRDRRTGDALRFTASFREVRFATSKVTATIVSEARPKAKLGSQVTKKTEEATATKSNKSALKRLTEGDVTGSVNRLADRLGAAF